MAKQFRALEDHHVAFIAEQHVYFVGSAGHDSRVNVSPKGMDSLRVLGPNRIAWLNYTGSGNETAQHLTEVNRMTIMWCSFTTRPLILRCYGPARAVHPFDADWAEQVAPWGDPLGARQVFVQDIDLVQTSCGYGVPLMDAPRERETMRTWTEDRGENGIRAYWDERNRVTIDGKPTGILPE